MDRLRDWPGSDLTRTPRDLSESNKQPTAIQNPVDPIPVAVEPFAVADRARFIRDRIPADGLFANQEWRISPAPFPIGPRLARELETLGRVLLQFYRAVNFLYRQSVEGKQPAWVVEYLDRGKPAELLAHQRSSQFKNEIPRVIRPDILLTESG